MTAMGLQSSPIDAVEVMSFIHTPHQHTPINNIDFVDAAGLLHDAPIQRQRHIQCEEQKGPVDAVMSDDDNGFPGVPRHDEAECVRSARSQVLQRFSIGKSHQMRRCKPGVEQHRIRPLNVLVAHEFPRAIVYIVERSECPSLQIAGARDRRAGGNAPRQRARVDMIGLPGSRNALCHRVGLGLPVLRERDIAATAKSFGLDAFDMSVTNENDFSHGTELSHCSEPELVQER